MVAMFGLIMPAPLLMPVMVTAWPPMVVVQRGRLRLGVGGHDGFGRIEPVVLLQVRDRGRQRGDDLLHRQLFQDHAGGERQHLLGVDAEQARHFGAGGRALARPGSPVAALALPVLTTSARIGLPPAARPPGWPCSPGPARRRSGSW
jgi:hypothetical protein